MAIMQSAMRWPLMPVHVPGDRLAGAEGAVPREAVIVAGDVANGCDGHQQADNLVEPSRVVERQHGRDRSGAEPGHKVAEDGEEDEVAQYVEHAAKGLRVGVARGRVASVESEVVARQVQQPAQDEEGDGEGEAADLRALVQAAAEADDGGHARADLAIQPALLADD